MGLPFVSANEFCFSKLGEKELLLLRVNYSWLNQDYAIGYYCLEHDIFHVWFTPGYSTKGLISRFCKCGEYSVNLPVTHGLHKGIGKIHEVIRLEEVLQEVEWVNVLNCGIPERSSNTYLVLVENKTIMLSTISCFGDKNSFTTCQGIEVFKGDIRAFHTALDTQEVIGYYKLS